MSGKYIAIVLLAISAGTHSTSTAANEHRTVSLWRPCMEMPDKVYIGSYLNVNTNGMHYKDINAKYCVPRAQCVAMGFCHSSDPKELAEAKKYKAKLEQQKREFARLKAESERKARMEKLKAEEAERKRIEAEKREQIRVAREAALMQKELNITQMQAQELAYAKSKANQSRPKQKETCTIHIKASESTIDYSGGTPLHYIKEEHAMTKSSSLCNGFGGTLGSLQCSNPTKLMGYTFAKCKAKVSCPAKKIDQPCSRGTKN